MKVIFTATPKSLDELLSALKKVQKELDARGLSGVHAISNYVVTLLETESGVQLIIDGAD